MLEMAKQLSDFIKRHIGQVDDDGWSIQNKHFVFHPHSYGIATLMRIGVRTRPGGWALLLHHFRPHKEDEFHDHPWAFRTFVLWGGYVDESIVTVTCDGQIENAVFREVLRVGNTRYRPAAHVHRTSCSDHVWTLVIARPKSRTWCKGTPDRWICGGQVEDFDAVRGMVKVVDD